MRAWQNRMAVPVFGLHHAYADDGYRRAYSGKASAIVNGTRVRVLGRIAMDYMMIDLTALPEAEVGQTVTLLGEDGAEWISAQEISDWGESVSGEVTAAISGRVPRIYVTKGE